MTAVNKLLNVVFACEIRGRLRCSAASIGYRGRIRKGFVHTPVTRLSRNCCQARNYRCGPASGLQPSDADRSCRHVRGYEHSPWICAPHALFLPYRADMCRRGSSRRRESNRRAFRFVSCAVLRRVGKGAKAQFARGAAAQRLCPPYKADIARPAARALAEPVATLPSRRARAAARSGIRSARTRSASRELRSAVQRRRPRSAS